MTDDCILASNTSSLSVTAMAAACQRPGRVAGYHFFNPVPVMKIVEVVDGELHRALGRRRAGRAGEALRPQAGALQGHARLHRQPRRPRLRARERCACCQEGVADFATIDRILVDAAGFRLGPFGLIDLVGLDVAHGVMKSMYAQYYEEPKYQPSFLADPRVAAGLLGRKTGRGWYKYGKDGVAEKIPEAAVPAAKPASVWCVPELKELLVKTRRKSKANRPRIRSASSRPLGHDATTTALQLASTRSAPSPSIRCSASPSAAR